ncbi:MAG: hypothetical protein JSS63_02690 [Bacteroidetes bacterium]|nr:hypothetical protein [Bacteroidota bacterium]
MPDNDVENITQEKPEGAENPAPEKPSAPKKKRGFFSKLFRFFLFSFIGIILLLVGLVLFLQTSFAKNWILHYAIDKVNESLASKESRIYAESIEGSIISGLKLNKASVVVKKDTLLNFEYIDLGYDLWGIPNKNVYVSKVILSNPTVNLTKVNFTKDSLMWNLNYLLRSDKPEEPEDTVKKPFDWKITADKIEIINGNFRILKNKNSDLPIGLIPVTNINEFGISNLFIKNFNLDLSAKYYPDRKTVDIKKINFNTNSDFNVKNLSLQTIIQKNKQTQVNNLNLTTNKTKVDIKTVSLDDFDPLEQKVEYEKFDDRIMTLDITTDKFDFDDLKFFLPDLNFLDGRVYLNFKVKGKYNNFTFEKLQLKTDNSFYNLAGTIKNLDEPDKLYLDVTSNQSEIDPIDTKTIIPGLPVPDYSHIGKLKADFHFVGEPVDFTADIDMNSSAGNISGKGSLNLKPKEAVYKGSFKTNNFNLGKLLKEKSLEGSVTGDISAEGVGFDYKTMRTKVNYEIRESNIFEQRISRSGGQIILSGGTADLNIDYNTNYVSSKIDGKVVFRDFKNIQYDVKGNIQNLNIAGITKNNSQQSSLNFTYDINGSGSSLANIQGDFKLDFSKSYYSKYQIPASPMIGYIHKSGDSTDISLKSNFIEMRASGLYTLVSLPAILSSNIEKISANIKQVFAKDSTTQKLTASLDSSAKKVFNTNLSSLPDSSRLTYEIKITDFKPIAALIDYHDFDIIIDMKGRVSNNQNRFVFAIDTGKVTKLVFQDSVFKVNKANLSMRIGSDNKQNINGVRARLNFTSDSLFVNNMKFDSAFMFLDYRDNSNKFTARIIKDSSIKLFSGGKFTLDPFKSTFIVDSLALRAGKYLFTDSDSLLFYFVNENGSRYFDIQHFRLEQGRQRANILGKYSLDDSSNVKVTLNNLSIAEIQKYLNPSIEAEEQIKGNFRRVELIYKGDLKNPEFHFETNSDMLSMGNTSIGRIDALMDYKDFKVTPDISFYNLSNTGNLKINGDMPIYISFNSADSAFIKERMAVDKINLHIASTNYQLRIIESILPFTSNLSGTLNGKLDVGGTGNKPLLTGGLNVQNGSFNVDLTRMFYKFEANLAAEGQKLLLNYSKLYTPDEDSRFISTTGYIDFSNLKLSDIDLYMTGDVKLFDKNNGNTDLGISGDLYGGSGTPQLHLKGNDKSMLLNGNLSLKKGNVTINPFQQETLDLYADNFNYKIVYDSSSFTHDSLIILSSNFTDSIKRKSRKEWNPFERYLMAQEDSSFNKPLNKSSFVYDITVTNETPIFLRFITNPKYKQEFYGEVNVDLFVDNRNNGNMEARGNVVLGDNSYYRFYKNFKAAGTVKFNGPIRNPELNIQANLLGTVQPENSNYETTPETVEIVLSVTGDATNPNLNWKLYKSGVLDNSADPSQQAINFILFGTFNPSATQQLTLASTVGANVGSVILSNYFSSFIQEILPFIVNTDFNYVNSKGGTFAQNTDIRITAEFGDAIVRVGGQVFDDVNNTNFVIQYPLGKLLKIKGLSNNLFIQVERIVDPLKAVNSSTVTETSDVRTGATVYYRIKF